MGSTRTPFLPDILRFGPSSFTSSQIALWTPTATTPLPTSPHYTQLFLAFWLGGFFCSIILPRLAFFAWGAWQTLRRSMSLGRDHNILRDGLGKRRRRSKRRRPIDFTTVPRRGLVVFQYIAERLVGLAFQTQLRRAFEHSIASVNNPNIRRIEMHTFQTMSAPRLHSGRMYDMGKKAMAFDVDATWNDAFESTVTITTKRLGVKVPVRIHNVKFVGPIRVILTPLIESPPGFGANIFSFPRTPRLDFDLDVAGGEITKVPWLKTELTHALSEIIEKQMVWPNRIVNPALQPNFNVTLIESDNIAELNTIDPFLQAESEYTKSWDR